MNASVVESAKNSLTLQKWRRGCSQPSDSCRLPYLRASHGSRREGLAGGRV